MTYTVTVPDDFNTSVARLLDADLEKDPREAIQTYLDNLIKHYLVEVIQQDPEVVAARLVLDNKVAEKTALITVVKP